MAISKSDVAYSTGVKDCYGAENELRLVVIGKTGSGKSSLGNSLLAKEAFPSDSTGESNTQSCKWDYREWNNRKLIVVDTPGMFDTTMPNDEVVKEIGKSIVLTCPGPHAVLFVINGSVRFTEEEHRTIELLKKTFGDGIVDYAIVVFTREDQMLKKRMTMKEWLDKAPAQLRKTLGECGDRFLTINNDADADTLQSKLVELNQIIISLLLKNNGDIYTNEIYEITQSVLIEKEERAQRVEEERIRSEERTMNTEILAEIQQERIRRAREHARDEERNNAQNEKGDTWKEVLQRLAPLILAALTKVVVAFVSKITNRE